MGARAVTYACLVGPARPSTSDALSDDAAAVARLQAGDEGAFEELVSRREREIYNLAYRMLGRREDALDAVQETFLRVFRALPRFRGEASFRTWVFGIALNVCRNHLASAHARAERHGRSVAAGGGESDGPGDEVLTDRAPDPERSAWGGELRRALERALATLSPEHREILLLREMQGMEYGELATVLGCRAGTVKSRLARARAALRAALEGVWP
jgi:RNA polymerase sigma-70 factor, ECF subfamily